MDVSAELAKLKGKKMQETMVRVSPETHAILKRLSEKHHVSMRQLIHLAVKLPQEQ